MLVELTEEDLTRIIVSLIETEFSTHPALNAVVRGEASLLSLAEMIECIDAALPEFDSLNRMELAGRLNEFFCVHDSGVEDYLLVMRSIDGFVEVIQKARNLGATDICFASSGSTGEPTRSTLSPQMLMDEIDGHLSFLPAFERVVSTVPPHHIYGFIWTVLLPGAAKAEVTDLRYRRANTAERQQLDRTDLIVSHPQFWRYLARSTSNFNGANGVSSAGALPTALRDQLLENGLGAVYEIYGSTETGGLAYRHNTAPTFRCLPHLELDRSGDDPVFVHRGLPERRLEAPDLLDFTDSGDFTVVGRKDKIVKIGGNRVSLKSVQNALEHIEGVQQAAVRIFQTEQGDTALKAFVVMDDDGDSPAAEKYLTRVLRECRERLKSHEIPKHFSFGSALPVSTLGKPADWPIDT